MLTFPTERVSGMRSLLFTIAAAILLSSSACTIAGSADKTLIQDQAAVGVGILTDWDKLTDDQKKQAYWKSTRGFHRLNNTLYSVDVPADFATDPWAKKTAKAEEPAKATAPAEKGCCK
jgi:hypothetical protein